MLQLNAFTNGQLVQIYNSVSETPLNTKKFKDVQTAIERVGQLLSEKELAIFGTVENYRIENMHVQEVANEPEVEVDEIIVSDPINEVIETKVVDTEVEASSGVETNVEATENEGTDVAVEVTAEQSEALDAAAQAKVIKRRAGTKLEQLVLLLSDVKGVTNEEAKEIFGWPAISIKTMAVKMGLELQMRKEGREKRYFLSTVVLPPEPEMEVSTSTSKVKKGKVTITTEEYESLLALRVKELEAQLEQANNETENVPVSEELEQFEVNPL